MTAFVRPAHAYIDPNAAGPFYQLLFPVIVAIMSMMAGLRRAIVRLWKRATGTRDSDTTGGHDPDAAGARNHEERIGGERS